MAREAVYNWTAPDKSAICALQTIAGAGSLVINGTLSTLAPPFSSARVVNLGNINRAVTITSPVGGPNLAGVVFTVTGTDYANDAIVEIIAGPGANATVQTGNIYKTVTSVTANGAIGGLGASIGIGDEGYTDWFWVDHYTTVENLGLRAVVTGTITYSFQATMDDVEKEVRLGLTTDIFTPITAMTAATTTQLAQSSQPLRFCRFIITNVPPSTGSAIFRIIQQGLL